MRDSVKIFLLATTSMISPYLAGAGELPDNPLWTKTVVSAGPDTATSICTDNNRAAIIAGHRAKRNAAFVEKYSAGGVLLWTKNAPATETPLECVTDVSNNIYTVDNLWIKKRSAANGTLLWRVNPAPGNTGAMHYEHIANPAGGYLWVSGNHSGRDVVMKIAVGNGAPVPIGMHIPSGTDIADIATNRFGDLFTIGATWLALSSHDNWQPPLWDKTCAEGYATIEMWHANGDPVWRRCSDRNLTPQALATGYDGSVYALGLGYGGEMSSAIRVRKYNHLTAAQIWEVAVPKPIGSYSMGSISVDRESGGNIVSAVQSQGGPTAPTTHLASLAPTGVLRWNRNTTRYLNAEAVVSTGGMVLTVGRNAAADTVLSKYAK